MFTKKPDMQAGRKTLCKTLSRSWQGQADYLRDLSRKDLELLWHEVQAHRESLDQFSLAVYSVLRDRYESEARAATLRKRHGRLDSE